MKNPTAKFTIPRKVGIWDDTVVPQGDGGVGGGVVVPGLFKFVPITNRKEVCCHFSTNNL